MVAGSDAEGRPALVPDPDRRAPGRGAHVHPTPECWQLAVRRRAFPRALRSGEGLSTAPVADHLAEIRDFMRQLTLKNDEQTDMLKQATHH